MVNGVRSNAGHSWSWKTASQIWFKTQIGRALVELRSPASSHVLFKQCFREFFWVVLNFLMFLILDSFMGFRVPFSSCLSSWSLILNCQMLCFRPLSIRRFMLFWTQSHLAAAESAHQARSTPGYVVLVSTVSTRLWPLPLSERWHTCCETALRTERLRRLRWVRMARRLCGFVG